METTTIHRPHDHHPIAATTAELRAMLRSAAASAAAIDIDDPAWHQRGPELTGLVNRVRTSAADRGVLSDARPVIAPGEEVAPVLRLRDLAHLQQQLRTAARSSPDTRPSVHRRTLAMAAAR